MLWPASGLVIGFSGSIWLNIWHDPIVWLNPFRLRYICCDFVNNLCIRFIDIVIRIEKSSTMRTVPIFSMRSDRDSEVYF